MNKIDTTQVSFNFQVEAETEGEIQTNDKTLEAKHFMGNESAKLTRTENNPVKNAHALQLPWRCYL